MKFTLHSFSTYIVSTNDFRIMICFRFRRVFGAISAMIRDILDESIMFCF
jgi:hypothetical protein